MQEEYGRYVEQHALPLLKWALHRTGIRTEAEDLSQEVWLQFFSALGKEKRKGNTVLQPEHLLWKIARYVWCRHLRQLPSHRTLPLDEAQAAPGDFAADLADLQEQQELSAWLHRQIISLSRIQREAFVLFYVDRLPQQEIARRLGMNESTLRWHLFETRRRIRQEAESLPLKSNPEETSNMTDTAYVYRPRNLGMGINGQAVPRLATRQVGENLLMQNILCACYREGRTPQELSSMLGVARPYIEHDAAWLIQQELLKEEKGRYFTTFLILTAEEKDAQNRVYMEHREHLSSVIVQQLLAKEDFIRSLGFIGSDQPMSKQLWWLIQHFCFTLDMPLSTPERPIRPDGGKYWPLGFDRTDPVEDAINAGWAYNGSMRFDRFYWFGLYNFGNSEIEDMLDAYTSEWQTLHTLLENLILHDFDLSCVPEAGKYALARLAEKGFLRIEDGSASPTFTILTQTQYDALRNEVFLPLAASLREEMLRLAEDMAALTRRHLPPHLQHLQELAFSQAMLDVTYITEIIAAKEGHLYMPRDTADGEFLTLVYIKP